MLSISQLLTAHTGTGVQIDCELNYYNPSTAQMLTLPKIILFLTAMLFVWFYYQGIRVRERALLVGRNYCKQFGVQFLDETVQRERVSLSRNEQGNWQVWRRFSFEFTESGENRQTGNITMLGYRVQLVELGGQRILH